jgi:hypothetical protein
MQCASRRLKQSGRGTAKYVERLIGTGTGKEQLIHAAEHRAFLI